MAFDAGVEISCRKCGRKYRLQDEASKCPGCGLSFGESLMADAEKVVRQRLAGGKGSHPSKAEHADGQDPTA